jgi:hypothetical protein
MKFLKTILLGCVFSINTLVSVANAGLITTSGDAVTGDVSISLDVSFEALSAGQIWSLDFLGADLDLERDAVRFEGFNQLIVEVNNVVFGTLFMDFNDGLGVGAYNPYIWFVGPTVSIGDIIRISGTASNGAFIFGNSPSTFTLLSSGDYSMSLAGIENREVSQAVPEPSTLVIFALGMMGLASRRFKK